MPATILVVDDDAAIRRLPRAQGEAVILVVSARDAVDEKVSTLDLGADDFVTKPFDTDELSARLRVALRHRGSGEQTAKIVRHGDLSIERQKLEMPMPVGSVIANELGVGYRLRADG